jgi:hypothetical protein
MYKAGQIGAWTPEEINRYERSVSNYFREWVFKVVNLYFIIFSEYHSKNLKIMVLNPTFAQAELIRSGFLILPAIFIGFFIMVCVSVSTVLLSATYFQQVSIHKVS